MIEAIAPLTPLADIAPTTTALQPSDVAPVDASGFASLLTDGVDHLNQSLVQANDATRALAAGENVPVHEVMIALSTARLDLQFAVQVRNRLLAAYQDITRMQV